MSQDLPRIPFVYTGNQPLAAELRGSVMLLGNFDGMHRGHAELVSAGRAVAREHGVPLAVLQCDPHPRAYFSGHSRFRVSTGLAQGRLLAASGIDLVFSPRFDAAFAAMTPQDFVDEVLVRGMGVGAIVAGRDFRFGRQREGNVAFLKQRAATLGFSVLVVDDQKTDGERISTSAVRGAIGRGDIGLATRLLGHAWLTEVHAAAAPGFAFAQDQILPPAGQWPVAALDRAGQHLAYGLVDIHRSGHVSALLPATTALVKWLPATIAGSDALILGRDAYA